MNHPTSVQNDGPDLDCWIAVKSGGEATAGYTFPQSSVIDGLVLHASGREFACANAAICLSHQPIQQEMREGVSGPVTTVLSAAPCTL